VLICLLVRFQVKTYLPLSIDEDNLQTTNSPRLPLLSTVTLSVLCSAVRQMVVRLVNVGSMVHAGDILIQIDLILSQLPGLAELELQFFDAPNPQYHRVHAFTPTWLIEHGLPSVTSRPQGVLRELRVTNATMRQVNYVQLQLIVSIVARCTGLLSLHLGPRIGGVLPCAADTAPYTQSTASEAIIMSALEGIALSSLGFGWVPFALASALLGGPRKTTLRTLVIQNPMYTDGMVRGRPAQISRLPSLLSRINGLSSISTLIITPPDTWFIRSLVEVVPTMWTMRHYGVSASDFLSSLKLCWKPTKPVDRPS